MLQYNKSTSTLESVAFVVRCPKGHIVLSYFGWLAPELLVTLIRCTCSPFLLSLSDVLSRQRRMPLTRRRNTPNISECERFLLVYIVGEFNDISYLSTYPHIHAYTYLYIFVYLSIFLSISISLYLSLPKYLYTQGKRPPF